MPGTTTEQDRIQSYIEAIVNEKMSSATEVYRRSVSQLENEITRLKMDINTLESKVSQLESQI